MELAKANQTRLGLDMTTHRSNAWAEGEGNILESPAPVVSAATIHKTFGPTNLTSTYSVGTLRVFGDIEPMPSGLETDAPDPGHPGSGRR
ncbi:hypothetical protein TNCV_4899191 [Trichonephila clavipes]|nr:hypothetical protein TNCV_4899191 [Trichonephila clavipes]